MPRWYSAGGRGGGVATGFALGPAPNLFADGAEDLNKPAGRSAGPAADKAAAEAERQVYMDRNTIYNMQWKSGGNTRTAFNYVHFISVDTFASDPWGTGPAWILPGGSKFKWQGKDYTTQADIVATRNALTDEIRFLTTVLDRKPEDGGITTGAVFPDNSLVPTLATWLNAYDKTLLSTQLYYTSGSDKLIQYQVYSSENGWSNVGSPVAVRAGKDGLPGDKTDFSSIDENHVPVIDASGAPIDSGVEVRNKKVYDPDGHALAQENDIPQVFPWASVTGKPASFYADDDFDTRLQALVTAGASGSVGATLHYDDASKSLSVVVGTNHPEPVINNFAMTGVDHSYTADHTLTGQQTWTWTIADRSSVRGDLTLSEERHDAGTGVTTTTDLSTSIASDATTVSLNVTTFALDDVGSYVEFTLKGMSVNSNAFEATFRAERQAAPATVDLYYGVVGAGTNATNFADATVQRSPNTYQDYFNIESTANIIQSGDSIDGDYVFSQYSGSHYPAFLIPDTHKALVSIKNKASGALGEEINAFTYIAPTATTKYHRYITASSQDGSFFPKTYTIEEGTV